VEQLLALFIGLGLASVRILIPNPHRGNA